MSGVPGRDCWRGTGGERPSELSRSWALPLCFVLSLSHQRELRVNCTGKRKMAPIKRKWGKVHCTLGFKNILGDLCFRTEFWEVTILTFLKILSVGSSWKWFTLEDTQEAYTAPKWTSRLFSRRTRAVMFTSRPDISWKYISMYFIRQEAESTNKYQHPFYPRR